jgi:hypothetical protein
VTAELGRRDATVRLLTSWAAARVRDHSRLTEVVNGNAPPFDRLI